EMTTLTSELAFLFRALKAPRLGEALPILAERARAEDWSYEQFLAALLEREVSARQQQGGEARIREAGFPARKTLEAFDFGYQASSRRPSCCTWASSTSWPAARTSSSWGRRGPARPIWRSPWASGPVWPASGCGSPRRRPGSPGWPRPSASTGSTGT